MDLDRGLFNLVLLALVLVVGLVRWLLHRARTARGEKVEEPPPPEPMLPYEDVVEEVFGPYLRRRRRQAEERESEEAPGPEKVVEEVREALPPEAAPPSPPAPREEGRPVHAPVAPVERGGAGPVAPAPPGHSLEERLLGRPGWGPAARLVVAAEILNRPRVFRPHGSGRRR